MFNWVNQASLVTILRYALQALGGVLVANGKIDAGKWETISGAILVLGPAIWGVIATNRPKVVAKIDGKTITVPMKELPRTTKDAVTTSATVAHEQKKTLADIIGGLFKRN